MFCPVCLLHGPPSLLQHVQHLGLKNGVHGLCRNGHRRWNGYRVKASTSGSLVVILWRSNFRFHWTQATEKPHSTEGTRSSTLHRTTEKHREKGRAKRGSKNPNQGRPDFLFCEDYRFNPSFCDVEHTPPAVTARASTLTLLPD